MKFVFQTIDQLEVRPTFFDEFEVFTKSRYDLYSLNYSPFAKNVNYEKAIEKLFKSHSTMSVIETKMESNFPSNTQDVNTQDAIVIFVPENKYSPKFIIVGGSCILNDKINTFLVNESETTVNELENMKVNWKIETLISFGNRKNLLMNGFISWHMCIKELFNNNLVMSYNTLSLLQRKLRTDFFGKIYDDQFSKLQIKRCYLQSRKVFVEQDIDKDTIVKLFKSVMTAKKNFMMRMLELIKLL